MKYYLFVMKNYAKFNGRARRAEYWYFVLFNAIFYIILSILGGMVGAPLLGTLYYLATIIPTLAVAVRRMHDVNKSGWYMLIPIYSFILAITEGDQGANEYGQDPKFDGSESFEEFGQQEQSSNFEV